MRSMTAVSWTRPAGMPLISSTGWKSAEAWPSTLSWMKDTVFSWAVWMAGTARRPASGSTPSMETVSTVAAVISLSALRVRSKRITSPALLAVSPTGMGSLFT